MTTLDASSVERITALASLESSRGAFLSAFACAPDDALSYRAADEDYALGGLLEHVAGVMRHYGSVVAEIRAADFGHVRVGDSGAEQDLALIARGLSSGERAGAVQQLSTAHGRLVAELERVGADDFDRKAPVVYGSAPEPYPTSARDIVGWVEHHYREHAQHIGGLLARRAAASGEDAQAVVERFGDAFNRHDLDTVMAMVTEDIVFDDTQPPPDGTRHVGKIAVRAAWQKLFDASPSNSFGTEEIYAAGDRAVVRWRYDWGSGHIRGVDVFRVRGGLVAEKLAYVKG